MPGRQGLRDVRLPTPPPNTSLRMRMSTAPPPAAARRQPDPSQHLVLETVKIRESWGLLARLLQAQESFFLLLSPPPPSNVRPMILPLSDNPMRSDTESQHSLLLYPVSRLFTCPSFSALLSSRTWLGFSSMAPILQAWSLVTAPAQAKFRKFMHLQTFFHAPTSVYSSYFSSYVTSNENPT